MSGDEQVREGPQRHAVYYWELVTFQVEDSLFRVPRHHFRDNSEIFSDMFALPQGSQTAEGNSDVNPIKLEGISALEFASLLRALYPCGIIGKMDSSIDWKAVLKLATLWRFLELRSSTINRLQSPLNDRPMEAIERIELGRKYFVEKWLRSGYVDLVMQPGTLTKEEAEKIGYATAFSVLRLREELRRKQRQKNPFDVASKYKFSSSSCPRCGKLATQSYSICAGCIATSDYDLELPKLEVEKAIGEEFRTELANVQEQDKDLKYDGISCTTQ